MWALWEILSILKLKDSNESITTSGTSTLKPITTQTVDRYKEVIEKIIVQHEKPKISIRLLWTQDSSIVLDFLQNSNQNHWPFANAIRSKCDTVEKVEHELWPWEDYTHYYNLYFWCFIVNPETNAPIMTGGIVLWVDPTKFTAEIWGMTRNDCKWLWFWQQAVTELFDLLYTHPKYRKEIHILTSVVSDTYNEPAKKVLTNLWFTFVKKWLDGLLYQRIM